MTKILIVDDNDTNRKLVVTLLGFEGYQTFEAADGAEGLRVAQSERPRLVISDILMPTMDGYEFVRRLRAEPELAKTAVIFYTANYHEHAAQALARKCDVDRVIVKPCESAEFLRIVKATLTGAMQRPAAAVPDEDFDRAHLQLLTDKLSQTADELRATNSRLAALVDLNVQLASEREPRTLLDKVCAGARDLLGARFAAIAVTDRADAATTIITASGLESQSDPAAARIDVGLVGRVMKLRRAARAANPTKPLVDVGLPPEYPPVHAVLAAPVSSLTRSYGWICLADKVGAHEFSVDDERLLSILGAQVGRIYENGSLYVEVQNHAAQLLIEIDERERAVAGLRASEQLFRQIAENLQDVLFIVGKDFASPLYVSPAFERVWGRPRQELLQNRNMWIESVHPADREAAEQWQTRLSSTDLAEELQYRIIRPDGSLRWVLTRLFPISDEHGYVTRAVGMSSDITERKAAETRIMHLNRVYAMLSGINSLIVRATDRQELLREACRLAVEPGRFAIAWCALLDRRSAAVSPVAWAGNLAHLAETFGASLTDTDNVIISAMASAQPVIYNDLRVATTAVANRLALLEHGYHSLVALPLVIGRQSVGCLVLVTQEDEFFDDDEMRLLTELSGDISFALDHIEKAEQLNYMAYYDVLTGLANHTLFRERLAQHALTAAHGESQFALVIADIERFSTINDTLGRTVGDQLLRAAATRLAECAGDADLVGRLGSDQLAAVIPGRRDTDFTRVVQDLWRSWLDAPFDASGHRISISAKAGIATFPADGENAETLLRHAESALTSAKESGRVFSAYTAQLTEQLSERLLLEKNLRRALEREEFVLHYQPQVDLATRRVKAVEALIRWQSPDLGLVAPGKFIPLAEQNGFIVEIGAWALRRASQDRARWLQAGLAAPRVAINVSTVQLLRDDFVRTVEAVVRNAGKDHGIDIEVTESLLMEAVADNLAKLTAIRELGVNIALDDFGTGYSSLAYLARLPVQTLKIDRSFIAAMLEDPGAMTLVSTIISLARALRLESVAEGVELEEQAKILRLLQCDQMQGFLISRALPFDEITAWLGGNAAQ